MAVRLCRCGFPTRLCAIFVGEDHIEEGNLREEGDMLNIFDFKDVIHGTG